MDSVALLAFVLIAVVYSWTVYNIPLLILGVRSYRRDRRERQRSRGEKLNGKGLPSFSVLIPAKNEEKVLRRLLQSLLSQRYPADKLEVIVVEDGSTDRTVEVCREFARKSNGVVRLLRADVSNGKSVALNRGLEAARGDIVAVFDADNILERDVLQMAAKYFEDDLVMALQGRTLTVNSNVNMLTKFISFEEAAYCEAYLRGRDALDLFVHLKGTCQFIRREVLEEVGGWRAEYLSDDFEMSARLTAQGHRVRYAPDVRSWQESPESLVDMFRQRVRWFTGAIEVALSYGRLMRRPSAKTVDAEVTLLAPFLLILSLLCYIVGPIAFHNLDSSTLLVATLVGWILLTLSIVSGGMALLYVAQPKKISDLLWVPFIYAYWMFQVVLASWALIKVVFRVRREWTRTPRTGTVATSNPSSVVSSGESG